MKRRIVLPLENIAIRNALKERFAHVSSCLPATGDFDEGAAGVEGARPTGVDVRAVVVVEDTDEVCTLQLGRAKPKTKEIILKLKKSA